jgi:hypothetical protein
MPVSMMSRIPYTLLRCCAVEMRSFSEKQDIFNVILTQA